MVLTLRIRIEFGNCFPCESFNKTRRNENIYSETVIFASNVEQVGFVLNAEKGTCSTKAPGARNSVSRNIVRGVSHIQS